MEVINNLGPDEEDFFRNTYTDIESLKDKKETSQKFLQVNDYVLDEPDFREFSIDEFIEWTEKNTNKEIIKKFNEHNIKLDFRSSMSNIYTSRDGKSKIFVMFLSSYGALSSVGIQDVNKFLQLVLMFGCNEGIMISEKSLTPKAKEKFYNFDSFDVPRENIHSTVHYDDSNFINITDHCLTPEIIKIYSGKELEDFLKKEKMTVYEFPKITMDDPIVKFYRAKLGNVIKMKRKTGTENSMMKEQLTYRTVVHTQYKNKK